MKRNPKDIDRTIKNFFKKIRKDYKTYKSIGILELKGVNIDTIPEEFNQCVFLNRLIISDCNYLKRIRLDNPNLYGVLIVSNRNLETIEVGPRLRIQKFFVYSNNPTGTGYIVGDPHWAFLKHLEVDTYNDFENLGSPGPLLESVHFINESYSNLDKIHRVGCKNIEITFDDGTRTNYTIINNLVKNQLARIKRGYGDFYIGDSCINFWLEPGGFDYKKIFNIYKQKQNEKI